MYTSISTLGIRDVKAVRRHTVCGMLGLAVLLTLSCRDAATPLSGAIELGQTDVDFTIYWPPKDSETTAPDTARPLLQGRLTLAAKPATPHDDTICITVTLTRPSTPADRESWNSVLAFADVPWMDQVRVWDKESQWQWPNLPYLLRLPGIERIERYGGVDPGKGVDNDFAAVLIRSYDARGQQESSATRTRPLVSAEWHAVGAAETDLQSVVHVARSDQFLVHPGSEENLTRGQLKIWLVYADFLGSPTPRGWPVQREWAGGILAYFEVDWEMTPDRQCRVVARQTRPTANTKFDWKSWVQHPPGADCATAAARLSDVSN